MGRAPCCSKVGLHRGPWTANEDALLSKYVEANGEGNWRSVPKQAGLLRCGKSCRLRWMNYLRPDIKRGNIEPDEEDLIIRLHALLGNRWSLIAGRLPGRTDNEIKNYWNTHLSKKLKRQESDPNTNNMVTKPVIQQEPVKKDKSSSMKNKKKQMNNSKMNDSLETKENKVYTPKATRLTSFSDAWNFGNSGALKVINGLDDKLVSGSSSVGGETGEIVRDGLQDFAWPGLTDTSVFMSDDFHALDFPYQSQIPTKDEMLEKIYEEYLELLMASESKRS